jgi:hypothetical protein
MICSYLQTTNANPDAALQALAAVLDVFAPPQSNVHSYKPVAETVRIL